MPMANTKRTVLITGASRGIGKAVCDTLAVSGMYEILAPTRQELNLEDQRSIEGYFKANSSIDILINNAGINILKAIDQIDDVSLHQMVAVNLEAPFKIDQARCPAHETAELRHILNVSSIWSIRSKEFRTLYSMTKSGLNGITRAGQRTGTVRDSGELDLPWVCKYRIDAKKCASGRAGDHKKNYSAGTFRPAGRDRQIR